jgi:hypothetical protein
LRSAGYTRSVMPTLFERRFIMTNERSNMKIVVIGGNGLIGPKLVTKLGEHGHQAVAASPDTAVNTLTGEGLAEVLKGASGSVVAERDEKEMEQMSGTD